MPLIDLVLPLRWRDLDAYGHVNNAQFLTFIEEARIRWFSSLGGPWRHAEAEPVLAAANVNFRRQMLYPAELRVVLTAGRIGYSSLTLEHSIVNTVSAELYSDGNSVVVWVSPKTGRPVPLPEVVRKAAG